MRSRCLGARTTRKTIQIESHEDLLIAARRALGDPTTAEHLRRHDRGSSGCSACLPNATGARKARYIGAAKARLQALWFAALVNLTPIGRHPPVEAV